MPRARKPAPDQAERDAAVRERSRNVLVDAGAGTGKTSILVERLLRMVAPEEGAGVPISRIAAITFTRKAAGELRLRIRESLLEELAGAPQGTERHDCLRDALAGIDTAYIGTIHSFADRLLRLHPVEAWLSPSYEIAEDDEPLVQETFDLLLQAAGSGTLGLELDGSPAAARAEEATAIVRDTLAAGLRSQSYRTEFHVFSGLDALVEGFVRTRDTPPADVAPAPFDAGSFDAAAAEFTELARGIRVESLGGDWLRKLGRVLDRLVSLVQVDVSRIAACTCDHDVRQLLNRHFHQAVNGFRCSSLRRDWIARESADDSFPLI